MTAIREFWADYGRPIVVGVGYGTALAVFLIVVAGGCHG